MLNRKETKKKKKVSKDKPEDHLHLMKTRGTGTLKPDGKDREGRGLPQNTVRMFLKKK